MIFGSAKSSCAWTAILLLFSAAEPVRAQDARIYGLDYMLYAGGLHAASAQTRLSLSDTDYDVEFSVWLDGFFGKLYTYKLDAKVAGDTGRKTLRPAWFHAATRWQDDDIERVEIRFGDDGPPVVIREPATGEERAVVPDSELQGVFDPISGALAIVQGLARSGHCEGRIPVFDGKRRYDLISRSLGEYFLNPSDYSMYSGPSIKCGVSLRRVMGFDDEDEREKEVEEIIVYLGAVVDGAPMLPVRLESSSGFGALRIHLVAAQRAVAGAVVDDR